MRFSSPLTTRSQALAGALVLILTALGSCPCWSGQQISVGPNVLVSSQNQELKHSEVIIAADPSNPTRLLACAMIVPKQPSTEPYRNIAYVSNDGGESWSQSLEFGGELWSADPSCAFGQDGIAFYAALVFDSIQGGYKGKTVLYASRDGGKTWSLLSTLPEGDREFLTVDRNNSKIYLVEQLASVSLDGAPNFPLIIYDSSNGGKSFETLAVLVQPKDEISYFGYPGGVLADGIFVTAFSSFPMEAARVGKFAEKPGTPVSKLKAILYNGNVRDQVAVSLINDLHVCDDETNSIPFPSLAVDSSDSSFRGRIYAAWPDSRSGRCEILFSASVDGGKSWAKPITVDEVRAATGKNSQPDNFHPVLAVNPRGIVGILWYDRRDNPDNQSWRPRFSVSLDGGQTFLPSVGFHQAETTFYEANVLQLDTRSDGGGEPPFHRGGIIHTKFGYRELTAGETAGLAADASGAFHASWIDNRNGTQQVWTARISVNTGVKTNGSDDLSALEDVSSEVAVLFSDVKLDRANQTLTAIAYLQNSSHVNLHAPLKLRVLRLESKLGVPEFKNADDQQVSSAAIFDFSSCVPGGLLKPGQRSLGKNIVVHLGDLPRQIPRGYHDALLEIVSIDSVVLGIHDRTDQPAALR